MYHSSKVHQSQIFVKISLINSLITCSRYPVPLNLLALSLASTIVADTSKVLVSFFVVFKKRLFVLLVFQSLESILVLSLKLKNCISVHCLNS